MNFIMRMMAGIGLAGSLPFLAYALAVEPSHLEVLVKPGSHDNAAFSIANDQNEPQHIRISTKDWTASPSNKTMTVARWLHVKGSTDFILKPKEKRTIKLKLKCPKETVGEVMGMVSFTYEKLTPSMVTPMISVAVYMWAAGTEKIAGEITDTGMRYFDQKYQAGATVKNTGNIHIRPSGIQTLYDAQGKKITEFLVHEGFPVLPEQTRAFSSSPVGISLAAGVYDLKTHLTSGDFAMDADRKFHVEANGNIHMEEAPKIL